MLYSLESGRRNPSKKSAAALRTVFGIGGSDDGNENTKAPNGLTLDDMRNILNSGWSLFYAGKGQDALANVESCLRSMSDHTDTEALALRGRFHQLAGVILRDSDHRTRGDSLTHGSASVQMARQVDRVDDLASALFRLARSAQHLNLDDHAVRLIVEAHSLAPRCRQPLAGWLHLAMVETQARVSTPSLSLREARILIDRAHGDLANRLGTDDSFTALNVPGIWHIEVLGTILLPGGDAHEALSRISGAIAELHRIDPSAHRWRYGMMATEALAYAAMGDAQACADLATDVLHVSKATSHRKYLTQALTMLAKRDPKGMNPHVARLRRLLAA